MLACTLLLTAWTTPTGLAGHIVGASATCRMPPPVLVESHYDQKMEKQRRADVMMQGAASVLEVEEEATIDVLALRELQGARSELKQALRAIEVRAATGALKGQILSLAASLNRGAGPENKGISVERQAQMEALVSQLEPLSPITDPLASAEINGRWSLVYTTSASILGINNWFRPMGPIHQTLDVPTLTARNDEISAGPWGLRFPRFVKAELEPDPRIKSKVTVRFRQFGLGPLRIKAPKRAVGELDTTYLDAGLRVSRGDKGNLFVLVKDDPHQ